MIENKIEVYLTENRIGFRNNRGTRKAILCLRLIIEKMFRISKLIYIAFVDLAKACDNVKRDKLIHIMEQLSLNFKEKRIMLKLLCK